MLSKESEREVSEKIIDLVVAKAKQGQSTLDFIINDIWMMDCHGIINLDDPDLRYITPDGKPNLKRASGYDVISKVVNKLVKRKLIQKVSFAVQNREFAVLLPPQIKVKIEGYYA